uniref:ATP synthase complex subunit 8 n=1 Tax=Trichocera bimacula TaxID=174634 RepID=G8J8I0_9DIPT|nr:ATP synthase F0 subunit 8 [Trichocera bimacula]AET13098.1 ATP synthase F0 subunit 8 [Trichocera bimacula]
MPQMAPLSWLILFIIFSITLILFNVMNYFMYIPSYLKSESEQKNIKSNSLNWKW